MSKRTSNNFFWGILLILLGTLFFLQNIEYLDIGTLIARYWPVILVLIGLQLIWKSRNNPEDEITETVGAKTATLWGTNSETTGSTVPMPAANNVFGDIHLKFDGREIKEFYTSNVFGDTVLDFSGAAFLSDPFVRVNGVFGDVNIRLPEGVQAEVKANYVAGSSRIFDQHEDGLFKSTRYLPPKTAKKTKIVRIEISIVFGDIRIDH